MRHIDEDGILKLIVSFLLPNGSYICVIIAPDRKLSKGLSMYPSLSHVLEYFTKKGMTERLP